MDQTPVCVAYSPIGQYRGTVILYCEAATLYIYVYNMYTKSLGPWLYILRHLNVRNY